MIDESTPKHAAENVNVICTGSSYVIVSHRSKTMTIQEGELLTTIVNAIPEAHAAVVAFIERGFHHG